MELYGLAVANGYDASSIFPPNKKKKHFPRSVHFKDRFAKGGTLAEDVKGDGSCFVR